MRTSGNIPGIRQLFLDYDSRIGETITEMRVEAGLDQTCVARAFGCQQPMVSKLEKGQRALKVSELNTLSQALGLPRETVVGRLLAAMDAVEEERSQEE